MHMHKEVSSEINNKWVEMRRLRLSDRDIVRAERSCFLAAPSDIEQARICRLPADQGWTQHVCAHLPESVEMVDVGESA